MDSIQRFKIPGFEIVKSIGAGAYGQVLLAKELSQLAMPRAVKVLDVHPFLDDPTAQDRFIREALSISTLKHTSIVGYISSGISEDETKSPYIVMEYIEGQDFLIASQKMAFQERVQSFTHVIDAMQYAHSHKVLHRDLKPKNILLRSADNNPVIVDFGLAYLFETTASETLTRSEPGTLGYIPQEVIANPRDRKETHDIYSCGVILYQILAGFLPNIQAYVPLSDTSQELVGLDRIISKAIAPVGERYKSMQAFGSDVGDWLKLAEERKGLTIVKSDFREKLLSKKQRNDEEKAKREKRERAIKEAIKESHATVFAGAEVAFRQVAITLKEVHGHFQYVQYSAGELPTSDVSPFPLFEIKNTHPEINQRMVFAATRIGSHGKMSDQKEIITFGKPRHVGNKLIGTTVSYLPLAWQILQEGKSQSPQSFKIASIAAIQGPSSDDKITYTLYGQPENFGILEKDPILLNSSRDVLNFVNSVLESHYTRF